MEDICENLFQKNWPPIKSAIKKNNIIWDQLVDQINAPIHYLAYHCQFDLIKSIGPNILIELIDQKNAEGNTVCHIAALMNDMDILSLAVNLNNEIIYERNNLGFTPLFYCVINETLIVEMSQNIKIIDHFLNSDYTLLEFYVLKQKIDVLRSLLKYVKLSDHTKSIMTTIIQSDNSSKDKIKLLKLFVSKGLSINDVNKDFLSPLIVAIIAEDIDIIKYLLEEGCDINYSGAENDFNPLSMAIIQRNKKLIELLLSYDADLEISNKYLETPVHHLFHPHVCSKINIKLKREILRKIANVDHTDSNMNSILSLVVQNDDWEEYEDVLEELKLKIYLKNKFNMSPYDYVIENGLDINKFMHLVYKSYLNQLDSDVDWADDQDKMISLMLENGDDISDFRGSIMDKIRVQSYPEAKVDDPLKLIVAHETNMTRFSADVYNYICFLCYILQKYSGIKTPGLPHNQIADKSLRDVYDGAIQDFNSDSDDDVLFRSLIRDYINHSPILINHLIIWKNSQKYFISPYIIQGIQKTLRDYPETKLIVLKLTLVGGSRGNHANVIIYDIMRKIIERFDPYGSVSFIDSDPLDTFLKSFFADYVPDATYLSPHDVSKGISFQVFSDENNGANYAVNDPSGFCMAWCLWYVEMRYKNIRIAPDALIVKAIYQINKLENKFKDYIRNYSNYIDHEKNMILKGAGVPKKMWYIHSLPIDVYKSYLKHIRKICIDLL